MIIAYEYFQLRLWIFKFDIQIIIILSFVFPIFNREKRKIRCYTMSFVSRLIWENEWIKRHQDVSVDKIWYTWYRYYFCLNSVKNDAGNSCITLDGNGMSTAVCFQFDICVNWTCFLLCYDFAINYISRIRRLHKFKTTISMVMREFFNSKDNPVRYVAMTELCFLTSTEHSKNYEKWNRIESRMITYRNVWILETSSLPSRP